MEGRKTKKQLVLACFRSRISAWMRRVAHQSVHDHVEVMSDPKSTEADVTEIVGGKNVHKGKGEE